MAPSSFACEKQRYGAKESFQMAPNTQAAIPIVNNQPRYFLVGDARGPRNRITMKQQNQLLNAIKGNKAARIRDPDAVKRRQAGWRDWAEQQWSAEARDFQVKELPAIQEAFVALFNSPNNRGSVATELRTVLFQSNLIKKGDIMTADEPAVATSATLTATSANSTTAAAVSTATATSTESTGAVLTATVTSTELSWPLSTATATSTESTVPVSTATSLPNRPQLLLYGLRDRIDRGSIDRVTVCRRSKNFWKRMVLLHSWINLQAAIGLERNEFGSESAQRKKARLHFLGSSGASEINQHYLEYSNVVLEEVE